MRKSTVMESLFPLSTVAFLNRLTQKSIFKKHKSLLNMVPEVLLALLGVPGEVIVLVPPSDGHPELFRTSPDLPFLEPPERVCLDRLVSLGYAFRCLEAFVRSENEAGTLAAVGATAAGATGVGSARAGSNPGRGNSGGSSGSGGSLYRRALAAGVSEVLGSYEAAILRLEQDILRGVTPAMPAALESALSGFALVLPALHATLRPVIESDGEGGGGPHGSCGPPLISLTPQTKSKKTQQKKTSKSSKRNTNSLMYGPCVAELRGAALLHHLHAAALAAGAPQLEVGSYKLNKPDL